MDAALLQLRVAHRLLHDRDRLLEQRRVQVLEQVSADRTLEVRLLELHARRCREGQLHLATLACVADSRAPAAVTADVVARLAAILLHHVLCQVIVEIVAAQVTVAVARYHLEATALHVQNRHIEGAASQVVDQNVLLRVLVLETVGEGGCRGLIQDAKHLEAGNRRSVLGRLTLAVVEVRGHRNHRLRHLLAQKRFRLLLHLF